MERSICGLTLESKADRSIFTSLRAMNDISHAMSTLVELKLTEETLRDPAVKDTQIKLQKRRD